MVPTLRGTCYPEQDFSMVLGARVVEGPKVFLILLPQASYKYGIPWPCWAWGNRMSVLAGSLRDTHVHWNLRSTDSRRWFSNLALDQNHLDCFIMNYFKIKHKESSNEYHRYMTPLPPPPFVRQSPVKLLRLTLNSKSFLLGSGITDMHHRYAPARGHLNPYAPLPHPIFTSPSLTQSLTGLFLYFYYLCTYS